MSVKQIWLYHKNEPNGKIFNLDEADEKMEEMLADGWVDTPAKLKDDYQPTVTEKAVMATMSKKQVVAKAESLGFHVLTDDELKEIIKKELAKVMDFSEMKTERSLIERFAEEPTDLLKEELVILGKDFDLSLRMTMKEATMIGHINKAIKNLQTRPLTDGAVA